MSETPDAVSRINVFVGYQIDSEFHTGEKIRNLMDKVSTRLRAENDINLDVSYGVFEPGLNLWEEVREKIAESQIAIFDISENNPNVLVEVGLAHGTNTHVIMLKNEKSQEDYDRPSDLMPLIFQPYPHGEIDSDEAVEGLANAILSFMEDRHAEEFYFRQVWGFEQTEPILVACSELPYSNKLQEPESNEFFYLGKFGDVDSLVETLVTLNSLYPRTNIDFNSADNVTPADLQKNLVLVGGPDYNELADRFSDRVPFAYRTGETPHDIYLEHQENGTTYRPRISDEPKVDYGFFAKTQNPHNPENALILLGGCHTYGVFGAAKAFGYHSEDPDQVAYNNCKWMVENYGTNPRFCALLRVEEIPQEGVLTPQVEVERCEHLPEDEVYSDE